MLSRIPLSAILVYTFVGLITSLAVGTSSGEYCEGDGLRTPISDDPIISPCKDKHPNCPQYAEQEGCLRNPKQMRTTCPMSCRVCEIMEESDLDDDEESCQDDHESCATWASAGECFLNPGFMSTDCRISCWTCVHGSSMLEGGMPEDEM
jgi:hypothetical protein